MALLVLLPAVACLLRTRVLVAAWCAGYYLVSLSPLSTAVADYFPDAPAGGVLAWLALSLLWAGLWTLSWAPHSASAVRRITGLLLVLIVSLVPPLGAVGFVLPLLGAGALLPGLGFGGLALVVLAWCVLAARPDGPAAGLVGMGLLLGAVWAHAAGRENPLFADGVQAVQTVVEKPRDFDALVAQVGQLAQSSRQLAGAEVSMLVFPESAVQSWRAGSEQLVRSLLLPQTWRHSIVLGTMLDPQRADRANAALILSHGQVRVMRQRQPLVLGMWAPWREDHVAADWLTPGVLDIDGVPVAIRVCGDELLPGLALIDFWTQRPSLIVALANHGWSRHQVHDRLQARHTQAVAQLFGVPYVRAVNRFAVVLSPP